MGSPYASECDCANPPHAACMQLCLWHPRFGITRTNPSLWQFVSDSENTVWDAIKRPEPEDGDGLVRYTEHSQGFDNYNSINNRNLGDVLEVGAGVYTQLFRLLNVTSNVTVSSVTFLEPNIYRYVSNKFCRYKTGKFLNYSTVLISAKTEDYHAVAMYDTVLVINVIEHVSDAIEFMTAIHKFLRPGGLLIWSERWFDDPVKASCVLGGFDLHPIRISKLISDIYLSAFSPIFMNTKPTQEVIKRNCGEKFVYFIGNKR